MGETQKKSDNTREGKFMNGVNVGKYITLVKPKHRTLTKEDSFGSHEHENTKSNWVEWALGGHHLKCHDS